ncbi:hypothetical protein SEVIR_4G207066v4 [Setaria viridis]
MRKGAAVGAGPGPERRPSSDPRLPGAIPLPAPPRRPWAGAGAAVAGGLGLGTVGAGSAACPGRGAWPGSAGSEPPLMDFFRAFGCEYFRFGTLAVSSSFFASPSNTPPPPPPPPPPGSVFSHSTPEPVVGQFLGYCWVIDVQYLSSGRWIGFPSVASGPHLYGAASPPIRCFAPVAAGAGNCGVSPDAASGSGLAGRGLLIRYSGWMDGWMDAGWMQGSRCLILCSYYYYSCCGRHSGDLFCLLLPLCAVL